MSTVVHFHYSMNPDGGDTRRIRNIDKSLCNKLGDKIIEVEFYGFNKRHIYKSYPFFTLSENIKKKYCFSMIYRYSWIGDFTSSLQLAYICRKHKADYVVGEFSFSSRSLKLVRMLCPNIKIIIDCHGSVPEEMLYENPKLPKHIYDYYEQAELKSCQIADYMVCQSDEMKRHLVSKYNADEEKIAVFKCGVNTSVFNIYEADKRDNLRKELNISNNDVVFIYAGAIQKWQKIDLSLKIFNEYHKHNAKSRFIILTRNTQAVEKLLAELKMEQLREALIITGVKHEDVPLYLNASDIAFLIRDNVVLNQVASPTKLAEYMACGLPIITSSVADKWVNDDIKDSLIFQDKEQEICKKIDQVLATVDKKHIHNYVLENLSVFADEKNIHNVIFKSIKSK